MINEYTSRYFINKSDYTVTLKHNTDLYGLNNILSDGYIDRKAFHKGECKDDVIWFTIADDFQVNCAIEIDVTSSDFQNGKFHWMNDVHAICEDNVNMTQYNFRITKVNGIDIYKAASRFNLHDVNGFGDFIEYLLGKCNGELYSGENLMFQLGRQFNCMSTVKEWFGTDYFNDNEDEINNLTECVLKRVINKIKEYNSLPLSETLSYPKQTWNKIQGDLNLLKYGYLTEGYYKTYPLNAVYRYISSMLGDNGRLYINKVGNHANINAVIRNVDNIKKELMQSFGLCGYYKSFEEELNGIENGYINMQFEPRYPDIDYYINDIGLLFHLTRKGNVNKILKNGLTPRSCNGVYNYPDRVYLIPGDASDEMIYDIAKSLTYNNVSQNGVEKEIRNNRNVNSEWCVLEINVKDINKDISFYIDANMPNGASVFTYDNIPPSAIKVIGTFDLLNR